MNIAGVGLGGGRGGHSPRQGRRVGAGIHRGDAESAEEDAEKGVKIWRRGGLVFGGRRQRVEAGIHSGSDAEESAEKGLRIGGGGFRSRKLGIECPVPGFGVGYW